MITTQKKYWVNGHHVRGGHLHTVAVSFLNFACMLSFSIKKGKVYFDTYKLTD